MPGLKGKVKLGDYIDLLTGFPFKSGSFTSNEGDIPLVKGENVHQGFIDWTNAKHWPIEDSDQYKKFALIQDDVVLAMDRPWIDAGLKWGWIQKGDPRCLLVQRVARLRGVNGLLTGYLRYIIGSPGFTDYIKPIVTGVNVPHISGDQIRRFTCVIPDVEIQRKIIAILSAYDDLITNATRRIEILEEAARRLYKEWFVEFRFPAHERSPRTTSPIGHIPKGWEVKRLDEIAENFDRLRKPLSKTERAEMKGEFPYYGAAKVFDYVSEFIFDGEYLLMAEDGSVITPERAPVLQLVNEKFWPNNHTHVLKGKGQFSTHFLYLGLSHVDVSPYITGAAQPKITQENMNRIPFCCGPEELHQDFDGLVGPMIRQTQILKRQTENLRRTRDLLLPKLISGELDVSMTDIAVEVVM